MSDYFEMGRALGSAYGVGIDQRMARERMAQQDKIALETHQNAQTEYAQRQQQHFGNMQALGLNPDGTLMDDSQGQGAVAPPSATPIGVRDVAPPPAAAPPGVGLAVPPPAAAPIGVRDVAPPPPAPAAAPTGTGLATAPSAPAADAPPPDPRATPAPTAAKGDATAQMLGQQLRSAQLSQNLPEVNRLRSLINDHANNIADANQYQAILNMKDDDPKLQELYKHVNSNSDRVEMAPGKTPDGQLTGYTELRIKGADGTLGPATKLSRADLAKVALGENKLQRGDMTGLDDIRSVNSTLSAAVAAESDLKTKVVATNNAGFASYDKNATRAEIAAARLDAASMRNLAMQGDKKMSPEDAQKVNDAVNVLDDAQGDPVKYAAAYKQYRVVQSSALAHMGKTQSPDVRGGPDPNAIKVNPDGSVTKGGDLFRPDDKHPGTYIKVTLPGESALDKAIKAGGPGADAKPGLAVPQDYASRLAASGQGPTDPAQPPSYAATVKKQEEARLRGLAPVGSVQVGPN